MNKKHHFEHQIEYTLGKKKQARMRRFSTYHTLYCKTVDGLKSFTIKWFWKYGNRCCVCVFRVFFLRLAINKYHQVWSLQVDAAIWTKFLNSKTHGKFPNQLAKSWTPVNSAADLLFRGWWNGDPGKLISMAGWKMDVWRMYFPWGCFGPLVVLVYRSVRDLLFKLITWPFVKTKKNLQIRFTIKTNHLNF